MGMNMKEPRYRDVAGELPAGDLTERLLRRANRPVGVINLRQAEQFRAHSFRWIDRRFELLENWKTRFGLDRDITATAGASELGIEWRSARGFSPVFPSGDPASVSHTPPSVRQDTPLATEANSESRDTSAQQFRVKRADTFPPAGQLSRAIAFPYESPAPATPLALPLVRATDRVSSDSHPLMHLQRKAVDPNSHSEGHPDTTVWTVSEKAYSSPARGRNELLVSAERGIPPAVSPNRIDFPVASQHDRLPAAIPISGPEAHLQALPPTFQPLPKVAELLACSVTPPREMHLQRKYSQTDGLGERLVTMAPQWFPTEHNLSSNHAGPQPIPISPEIFRAPALPGSNVLVWRKPAGNDAGVGNEYVMRTTSEPSPSAGVKQLMRQAHGPDASGPSGASDVILESGTGGMDAIRMAEQVSRIIARQLVIERERRGRTR